MERPRLVQREVDGGTATIEPDLDRPHAATLFLDGTPQSYVDLADPTFLCFEYVAHIGTILDVLLPDLVADASPLRLLHLGGGALTLPRYVATVWPRSQHRVAEIDARLVQLVRAELPIDPRHRIRISTTDARELVARTRPGTVDAMIVDVFAGARVPPSMVTAEFFALAAATLAPHGVLIMNVVDKSPLLFARRLGATVRSTLPATAMSAEPAVWRGRRFGNLVVTAGRQELPVAQLTSRLAGGPFPARLQYGAALDDFIGDANPLSDAHSASTPVPPPDAFGFR